MSVQQRLEEAVFAINGVFCVVHGAGRTDAGVHALGQVAHVDLKRVWCEDRLRDAINAHLLPSPIAVLSARPVGEDSRRVSPRARATTDTSSTIAARR